MQLQNMLKNTKPQENKRWGPSTRCRTTKSLNNINSINDGRIVEIIV